jgi:hypothetical protein
VFSGKEFLLFLNILSAELNIVAQGDLFSDGATADSGK